ncbi:tol-pal system protein YbgF [Pseudaminobacter sp. 19-2017]|uniref:Cell division coordinator CpoB n=1 Tax=Pseudaminobacter soli (ex Zhang et al. 2022) TaxID=2831468 RepID=A0A942DZ78_9HYPH|nr:tol-pal system protein YbgF [Pseudaminobacter soli]MBS3647785.1 tol-pal system protein YbgF [Pseudaminobacter soli]
MYYRSILSGTLAAVLLSAGAVFALERETEPRATQPSAAVEVSFLKLPGVFNSGQPKKDVQLAQASDPRVVGLEEQVRTLNGTVEELNFQILQLQEQLRKIQEDNEFRFQELEKRSDARSGGAPKTTAEAKSNIETASKEPAQTSAPAAASVEDLLAGDQTSATDGTLGAPPATDGTLGTPPKTFGTITVDKNGNVKSVGEAPASVSEAPPVREVPTAGTTETSRSMPKGNGGSVVAALPPTDDPEELYRNSYQFILSGDYSTAETGFRDHIARFPKSDRAADANFWLGEALLGQKKYSAAAETFLAASKQYSKSKKAPDMLLKLGVALTGLNQREVACATFSEVGKRYPNASSSLKERVKQEQAKASC